jgi:hypothetical protein
MAKAEKNIAEQTKLQEYLEKKILKLKGASSEKDKKSLKRYKEKLSVNKDFLKLLEKELTAQEKISAFDKKRNLLLSKAKNNLSAQVKITMDKLGAVKTLAAVERIQSGEGLAALTAIEEQEKAILSSMTKEGILTYDIVATQESLKDLKESIANIEGDEGKILQKRLGMLNGEHKLMKETAEKAQAKNKFLDMGLSTMGSSVAALKGMVKGAKAFAAAIIANPLMAIAAVLIAIVGYLWGAVTATRDMSKEMGVSLVTAAKMQGVIKTMPGLQAQMKLLGRDLADSATAIYHATRSTRDINKENVKTLSTLAVATGASETNIANMARMFADMNGMSFKKGLGMVTATANLAEKFGVDKGAVISDIAESAEDFATYTNGSMKNLQMAAIHAQKMGTSLATTMKMTESLLDFETSITNTMEASMMIGKNLNFDKARMLAMDNDILGATNEIVRQLGSAEEFTRLSAIQRKKLAASIGVEVSELSRLVSGKPLEVSTEEKQKKLEETQLDATKELTAAIEVLTKTMTKDITSKIGATLEKGAEIAKATGGLVGAAYIPMDYLWKKLMNSTD